MELVVHRLEFLVHRLQLLVRRLELLVRRLQLLHRGLELLVRRLQLLVRRVQLLVGGLELAVGVLELELQPPARGGGRQKDPDAGGRRRPPGGTSGCGLRRSRRRNRGLTSVAWKSVAWLHSVSALPMKSTPPGLSAKCSRRTIRACCSALKYISVFRQASRSIRE